MIYPRKKFLFKINRPDQSSGTVTNPSPVSTNEDEGRMGFTDLSKIVQVNDDDNVKVGEPFVGILGSLQVFGKCSKCMHLMYSKPVTPENKDGSRLAFCPGCRKQFYYGVDPVGRVDFEVKPEMESGGQEMMTNAPTPAQMSDMGSQTFDPSHINSGY